MSNPNENAVDQTNAVAAAQEPVVTPDTLVEQLRALRAQVPNYVQLTVSESAALRTVSNLHPDFAQAAINAVGSTPKLEVTVGQSAEELQAIAEEAARWSTLRAELQATTQGVSSAILTLRHRLGEAALLTYAVSKKLVKQPEHADLLPHLANMRKTNRLGRGRKKQAQTPAPAPVSEPAPVQLPVPSSTPHV